MSDIELLFLIPSRGRPEALVRCVDSIAATTNLPAHVLVAFDDDASSADLWKPRPYVTTIALRPRHYFVRAMNRLYAEGRARFPNVTHFVVANDDDTFVMWDWGRQAKAAFAERFPDGDGVVELFWSGRLHTWMSTTSFFDSRGGYIYDPAFTQYFSDQLLQEDLQAEARYAAYTAEEPARRIVSHNILSTLDATASETWKAWERSDNVIYEMKRKERES